MMHANPFVAVRPAPVELSLVARGVDPQDPRPNCLAHAAVGRQRTTLPVAACRVVEADRHVDDLDVLGDQTGDRLRQAGGVVDAHPHQFGIGRHVMDDLGGSRAVVGLFEPAGAEVHVALWVEGQGRHSTCRRRGSPAGETGVDDGQARALARDADGAPFRHADGDRSLAGGRGGAGRGGHLRLGAVDSQRGRSGRANAGDLLEGTQVVANVPTGSNGDEPGRHALHAPTRVLERPRDLGLMALSDFDQQGSHGCRLGQERRKVGSREVGCGKVGCGGGARRARRLRLQRRYHQGQRGNEYRAYPPFHPYPASLTPFEDGSGRRSCRTPAPLAPIASAENLPSTPEPRYNKMSLQRQLLSRTPCRLSKARHRPTEVRRAAPDVPPRAGRNAGAEPARRRAAQFEMVGEKRSFQPAIARINQSPYARHERLSKASFSFHSHCE
jgi:hypothetical protein